MEPLTTISEVNKDKVGNILNCFLKDKEIYLQEVNFMNPHPTRKSDNKVIPHNLFTASINAGEDVPKGSEMQKVYENTGLFAQCIGAFDSRDKNRMSIFFMPGNGENVRVMATIYSDYYKAPMNGLLQRIGLIRR